MVKEYGSDFSLDEIPKGVPNLCLDSPYTVYLRSGRECLKYVGLQIESEVNRILMPALCCRSMVKAFTDIGFKVDFYRLEKDLTVDWTSLLEIMEDNLAVVYINYFGRPTFTLEQLVFLKAEFRDVFIIKDATHDFFDDKVLFGVEPDYVVASLRKWFALPDGGIVKSTRYLLEQVVERDPEDFFTKQRTQAMLMKHKYLATADVSIKPLYRDVFSKCATFLSEDLAIMTMSDVSRILLEHLNVQKMSDRRRDNFMRLYQHLEHKDFINISYSSSQTCPLYFPVVLNIDRDFVQKELAEHGIYCPVIWPIPSSAVGHCQWSEYFSANMLALPCDHRYTESDMEYVAATLETIIQNMA